MFKVLLYYKYVDIPHAEKFAQEHLAFCKKNNILGRIIIADEGINGTCAGKAKDIERYQEYLRSNPLFSDIEFKESDEDTNPFRKIFVRYRDEIVTSEFGVDLKNKGRYISADELHQLLDRGEKVVLMDMRNEYESRVGKFKNSLTVDVENFREIPNILEQLTPLKKKKIITYCTGGIRCEKASALLVENGFEDVYQLHGGIDQYAKKYPKGFFEGKMYVFDGRVAVAFDNSPTRKVISKCVHCGSANDDYVNCANAECNDRLIMCPSCQEKFKMSCSPECASKSRYLAS